MGLIADVFLSVLLLIYKCALIIEIGGTAIIDALNRMLLDKFNDGKYGLILRKVLWGLAGFEFVWLLYYCFVEKNIESVINDTVCCSIYGSVYGAFQMIGSSVNGELYEPIWIFSGLSVFLMAWLFHAEMMVNIPSWAAKIHIFIFNIWFGSVCGRFAPVMWSWLNNEIQSFRNGALTAELIPATFLLVLLIISLIGAFRNVLEIASDIILFTIVTFALLTFNLVFSRFNFEIAAHNIDFIFSNGICLLVFCLITLIIKLIMFNVDRENYSYSIDDVSLLYELPLISYIEKIPVLGDVVSVSPGIQEFILCYLFILIIMLGHNAFYCLSVF